MIAGELEQYLAHGDPYDPFLKGALKKIKKVAKPGNLLRTAVSLSPFGLAAVGVNAIVKKKESKKSSSPSKAQALVRKSTLVPPPPLVRVNGQQFAQDQQVTDSAAVDVQKQSDTLTPPTEDASIEAAQITPPAAMDMGMVIALAIGGVCLVGLGTFLFLRNRPKTQLQR